MPPGNRQLILSKVDESIEIEGSKLTYILMCVKTLSQMDIKTW